MRTRFLRGDTAQNNTLTLPAGEVSVDTEKKAVRLHDGSTLGGFEIIGSPIEFPAPGPTTFEGGDVATGFYGEVLSTELITYSQLSIDLGISAGTLQHDAESVWLKFALDGKIIYVAKKNIRSGINWTELNSANSISGNRLIEINSKQYKIRLLKGVAGTPVDEATVDPVYTHGSEWNRLMYPIHQDTPTSQEGANWASYTNLDLNVGTGSGRSSWCQENIPYTDGKKVLRGDSQISKYNRDLQSSAYSGYGWRPVLELVE